MMLARLERVSVWFALAALGCYSSQGAPDGGSERHDDSMDVLNDTAVDDGDAIPEVGLEADAGEDVAAVEDHTVESGDEDAARDCSGPLVSRVTVEPHDVELDWSPTPTGPDACSRRTQRLTATAEFADGSMLDVTTSSVWRSSNPSVVYVDEMFGVIQAVGAGGAEVRATYGCVESNMVEVYVDYCTGP